MKHTFILNEKREELVCRRTVGLPVVKAFLLFCFIFMAYSFSNSAYAQTDKAKKAEQREQLMAQLEANMESFLVTVQNKREQNQKQLEEFRLELQTHLAKKKSKKTQAMDEQIEQALRRKIASMESKEKDYDRMENDAVETLITLDNQLPPETPRSSFMTNTIAQYKQKQSGQLATSTSSGQKQGQEQQKNGVDVNTQTKTSSTAYAQTDGSGNKQQKEQLQAQMKENLATIQAKREQNQQQLEELRVNLEKQQAKKSTKKTQAADQQMEQSLQTKIAALEKKDKELQKMEADARTSLSTLEQQTGSKTTVAQNGQSTSYSVSGRQSQEVQKGVTDVNTQPNTAKSANTQRKEALIAQLDANAASFLVTVRSKRELNQQQLTEVRTELEKQQAKKKTKKTQAMDEQIENALKRKVASLEHKEQEYQRMENDAIALQTTLQAQSATLAQHSTSTSQTVAQNQQKQLGQSTASTSTTQTGSQNQQKQVGQSTSSTQGYAQNQQKQVGQSTSSTQGYAQNQTRPSGTQPTTTTPNARVSYGYQPANKNVTEGYYVVFGSFVERDNAVRFLARLQTRFSNVVDIGNDNVFGMYRTGIGPYATKEEAVSKRPSDMKNWVLRIETIPNTRLVAYIEILEEE